MNNHWPLRWDLLQRYRLIEIIAQWEGRLTTNHLCSSFGIGRQQASKDINTYLHEIGKGNLEYDRFLKGYKPTTEFKPKVTTGLADEYLHLLNRNRQLSETFEGLALQFANTEVLNEPVRNIKETIIRPIVNAARGGRKLEVDYVSIHNPNREGRIIVPHTLVYTGLRWHVRAWCEKNQDYRDFVLSRFRGKPEIEGDSQNLIDGDKLWNTHIVIRIKPDPRLSTEQRAVVAQDYGMTRNLLKIETRAALAQYVLQSLRIDTHTLNAKAEAQQIIIDNFDEIQQWLFD